MYNGKMYRQMSVTVYVFDVYLDKFKMNMAAYQDVQGERI